MATAAPALEHKRLDFRIKDLGGSPDDPGSYRIYAATFNNVDRQGEAIAPGAFRNLDAFVRDGFMAVNHRWDSTLPIGTIDRATQDQYGLLVEGKFHSTPEAQASRTIIKERMSRGKSVQASIGYVVTLDARVTENGRSYRLLKGIELLELSWVNVPANPLAIALDVKATATKEGRTLSAATRRRIAATIADLQALLDEYDPPAAGAGVDVAKALDLRRRRIQLKARLALMGISG